MTSYDDWKCDADAAPDPGRGGGHPTYRVRCRGCAWTFTGTGLLAASSAVAHADRHHAETGHAIVGRNGIVQARWAPRRVVFVRGAA
jgi:hypothetical protein